MRLHRTIPLSYRGVPRESGVFTGVPPTARRRTKEQIAGRRGCPAADERQPDGSTLLRPDRGSGGGEQEAEDENVDRQMVEDTPDSHSNLRGAISSQNGSRRKHANRARRWGARSSQARWSIGGVRCRGLGGLLAGTIAPADVESQKDKNKNEIQIGYQKSAFVHITVVLATAHTDRAGRPKTRRFRLRRVCRPRDTPD